MKPEHEVLFVGLIEYPEVTAWARGYYDSKLNADIGSCPYFDKDEKGGLQQNWFDGYLLYLQEQKAIQLAEIAAHKPFGIRPKH